MDKHRNQLLFQFGNVCLTSLQCSLMDSNMLGGLSTIDTPIVLTDPKPKTECSCLDMLNYGAKKCFFTVKNMSSFCFEMYDSFQTKFLLALLYSSRQAETQNAGNPKV